MGLGRHCEEPVGWVERSDTHHCLPVTWAMGFAALYPSYAETHLRIPAARFARALQNRFAQRRGRRECRVLAAPAVPCARDGGRGAHEHTGTAGALRHSPRNGFTAYAAQAAFIGLVFKSYEASSNRFALKNIPVGKTLFRSAQLHFPTRQTVLVLQN